MRAATLVAIPLLLSGWLGCTQPAPPADQPIHVRISEGSSLSEITQLLYDRGVIENRTFFLLLAHLRGSEGRLKAGLYGFSLHQSPASVLSMLEQGRILYVDILVPPGLTTWQIAALIAPKFEADEEAFLSTFQDSALARRLGVPRASLEGYLFPDTYRVPLGISPESLAETVVGRFNQIFTIEMEQAAQERGLTIDEVVTLASIVEKEGLYRREFSLIAAVYRNRLRRGKRLEADPTVLYAIRASGRRVLYRDLEVDSSYNTYRNPGLPPGPICSPSVAALKAAIWPANVPYLYFVARGDGTHIFSETYTNHLRAIQETREEVGDRVGMGEGG